MKSILLIAALFFIAVNAQGTNFGSELANLPFGNVIGGPLTACIEAQVYKFVVILPKSKIYTLIGSICKRNNGIYQRSWI
jgi:hypothetical protein